MTVPDDLRQVARGGAASRRRERAEARRSRIVAAAKRLFAASGLEAVSMRGIAAEAGCTTGAIYPCFSGKDEIYAAVLGDSLEELRAAVAAATKAQTSPAQAACAGLSAFYRYYAARPDELALGLYLHRGLRPSGLNRDLDTALNRKLQGVFRQIEESFAGAGAPDPAASAAAGIAQAVGLLVLERTGRVRLFGRPAEAILSTSLEALLLESQTHLHQ